MKLAVTGAYGYSGKYITRLLLDAGHSVITLTNSPNRPNPFGAAVEAHPFHFDRPEELARTLQGLDAVINTYWIRFNSRSFTIADAVKNSQTLFRAAREAGVGRFVHVSIANPSENSPLEYFRGKAVLEKSLRETGIPYSILRPAILFGGEDILINNIAWTLRRFPVYGVFGDGRYKIQPIHIEDFAALAVEQADAKADSASATINAVGPEIFEFRDLVAAIGEMIGCRRPIMSVPPFMGYLAATGIGLLMGDVPVTRDEITGLMSNLLCVDTPPTGKTKLTDWVRAHADTLGRHYASEMARRRNRSAAY